MGASVTYSASGLPTGAVFDSATGTFTWTPSYSQSGNYQVTFTATDSGIPPASTSATITITVGDVNRPPQLQSLTDRACSEDSILVFTANTTDPENDTLAYSAGNLPSGKIFDASTQTFTWAPGYTQAGDYSVPRYLQGLVKKFRKSQGQMARSLCL